MANTTIHTLAYKIVADASKFKSEMHRTNAELKAAKDVVNAYTPAVNKHRMEIESLNQLHAKGHFAGNMQAYNKALSAQEKALFQASLAGKAYNQTMRLTRNLAVAGVSAGAMITKSAFDQFEKLELLHKSAVRMGANFEQLQHIVKAAQLEDVDEQAMMSALEHFNKLIGAADQGNAKALKTMELLKLEAGTLKNLTLEEKLLAVADAMAKIPDEETRLLALQKTLGDTGVTLYEMLTKGRDGLSEQLEKAKELGDVVSETEYEKIGRVNDAMDKFAVQWQAILRQLAAAMAPMLERIVAILDRLMPKEGESVNPLQHMTDATRKGEELEAKRIERMYLEQKRKILGASATLTPSEQARLASPEYVSLPNHGGGGPRIGYTKTQAEIMQEMLNELKKANQNSERVANSQNRTPPLGN